MIQLNFSINNPTKFKDIPIKNFNYCINKILSKNKFFEFQFANFEADNIFSIELDTSWYGYDHAGPKILFEFFGIMLIISIYDNRHWDYYNHCWQESK